MKVIVGLGNPGQTYHDTRHNVGFMVIQRLGERHQAEIRQQLMGPEGRPAAVSGNYGAGAEAVRLMMPLTMMNGSGDALRGLAVERSDLLIVCDDVNLPLGVLRLRPHGSAGGHHGLRSCLEVLATEDVPRLRLGVGTAAPLPKELHDFVLSSFTREERPMMQGMIEQAADACETWITKGMDAAMNQYNRASES